MKNIVITGASGFIGKYIVKEFLENNQSVVAVVRSDEGIISIKKFLESYLNGGNKNFSNTFIKDTNLFGKITFIKKDVKDLEKSDFQGNEYEGWIHLAWGGVNRTGVNDEIVQKGNYEYAKHCLHLAQEIGCSYFADSGSRAECGNDRELIEEKSDLGEPLNKYGFYKREFYQYAKDYCEKEKIIFQHFRLFSVIGPEDHPWSVIMTACRKTMNQELMQLGSCEQIFNFLDVIDVAKAVYICFDCRKIEGTLFNKYNINSIKNLDEIAMDKSKNLESKIINVAMPDSKILRDYIESIPNIMNMDSIFQFGSTIGFNSNPAIMKLTEIYGWRPTVLYEDSIKRIFEALN